MAEGARRANKSWSFMDFESRIILLLDNTKFKVRVFVCVICVFYELYFCIFISQKTQKYTEYKIAQQRFCSTRKDLA